MPQPRVVQAPDASRVLREGIDVIADLLGGMLGPMPAVTMDQAHAGYGLDALDDAPAVVRRIISLGDQQMDVSAMLLRNLVWQMEENLGDGGAMVAVLTQALVRDALRLVEGGVSPMRLAAGLRRAVDMVEEALGSLARPVRDEDQLARTARTVTGHDAAAALIGEMLYVMGPDAIIDVEEHFGRVLESRYTVGAALKAVPAHWNHPEGNADRLPLNDCLVAAVDGELAEDDDMLALMTAALHARKGNLLILARGFSETIVAWLALNDRNANSPVAVSGVVFEPTSSAADCPYEDLTCLTGATILGLPFTKPVGKVQPDDLGHAVTVDVSREGIRIEPEPHRAARIHECARQLRAKRALLDAEDPSADWLRRRIAAMDLGAGQLRVGADTNVEREWLKRILERGIRSVGHALRDGVVPGGGFGYVHVAKDIRDVTGLHPEEQMGLDCACRALDTPALRIMANAGVQAPRVKLEAIRETGSPFAYDIRTGSAIASFAEGLVDPLPVVREAFRLAVTGASTALTINTLVLRRNPPKMAKP
ncbi:MAG: hypothetical protein J4G06_10515 [Caldilineaceae bacterium]|nr:hypothetical protein [Caldilineaceae bacterium]